VNIAVIGGGASGVLACIHLLSQISQKAPPARIMLFEPKNELGRGYAYSGKGEINLLNVRAEKMSYSSKHPLDFLHWLEANAPEALSSVHFPFVPRPLFGSYLAQRLSESRDSSQHAFVHIREKVARAEFRAEGWRITTQSQIEFTADSCVLATGYREGYDWSVLRASAPCDRALGARELRSRPEIFSAASVTIIGAGLSAIDVWRELRDGGMSGEICFVSRRGMLPLPHGEGGGQTCSLAARRLENNSPSRALRTLRDLARNQTGTWAQLADECRAQAPALWASWTLRQRRSFLEHLLPYWDSVRHRAPALVHEELCAELKNKRACLLKARVAETLPQPSGGMLLKFAGGRERKTDWVVLATGVAIEQDLPEASFVKRCALGLGFEAEKGKAIHVLGPPLKCALWETTSIPDIRVQAEQLAARLLGA